MSVLEGVGADDLQDLLLAGSERLHEVQFTGRADVRTSKNPVPAAGGVLGLDALAPVMAAAALGSSVQPQIQGDDRFADALGRPVDPVLLPARLTALSGELARGAGTAAADGDRLTATDPLRIGHIEENGFVHALGPFGVQDG